MSVLGRSRTHSSACNALTGLASRNPADLAVLKSLGQDASENEQNIVEVFGQGDDVLTDFEFTPIHKAVLQLYDTSDSERPSLEE